MTDTRELTWLRRLREVSARMGVEHDSERLFTLIIESAIELTDAERGFMVRLGGTPEKRKIKVEVALGFDGEALRGAEGKVSKTVVDRVLELDRSVVTTREDDTDILEASSVQERRVRSIVCVPMRLRGETCGILYLDHRFNRQAFTERDLPCLEAFADQAVLALETAELLDAHKQQSEEIAATLQQIEELQGPTKAPGDRLPDPALVPRFGGLVGGSNAANDLYRQIERAARSYRSAIIVGEAGCGKASVAREIHDRSPRSTRPFLIQGCSGIDPIQLEGDLFGRQTLIGTIDRGLFEQASPGTLLLTDIEALSLASQAKLLRAVKEGIIVPLGTEREQEIRCRLLVAFRGDPQELVRERKLREDLFCLLSVQRIDVPPLRERAEDIPALLSTFLRKGEDPPVSLAEGVMDRLVDYGWPGNVRELANLAQRVALLPNPSISVDDLPETLRASNTLSGKTLKEVKRELIVSALEETGGSKTAACRKLGIPRSTLYRLLERFDIS